MKFIRYADHVHAYWTGYFTSRPALKGYVRMMSAYYLVNFYGYIYFMPVRIILAQTRVFPSLWSALI